MGWIPDSYERIISTQRLLGGEFPLSRVYPPGLSILLAPVFAVFPQTLATMQWVIVASGVALVLVSYAATIRLTGDRLAATLFALLVALHPAFVASARDALFDSTVALILAACVFLLPALRGRGVFSFIAYGCLLALLVNIRPTNAVCLPAIGFYWTATGTTSLEPKALARALLRREVIAAGATLVLLTLIATVAGGWGGQAKGVPITLATVGRNFVYYEWKLFEGSVGVVCLGPLCVAGAFRLWRADRPLTVVVLWVLVAWPLAHSPFPFTTIRYLLPARVFVLFLASLGASRLWQPGGLRPGVLFAAQRVAVGLVLLLFIALEGGNTVRTLHRWPDLAAQSDEGMFREVRPVLADLPGRPLIVSAVARGLRDRPEDDRYLDLIDWTFDHGGTANGTGDLDQAVSAALVEGRPVYYLYSRWEAGDDFQGEGRDGYARYFDAIRAGYRLTEVFHARVLNLNRYLWTLYRVEALPPSGNAAPTRP